tara:strand:- start:1595 stop:2152 length:558 start_codon:yes stop_codon:yes gene_type:complete
LAYVKGALELAQEQKERNIQEHQERQQNYTTSKQIESLLNSKVVSNKDTTNLDLFLKERNWTANTAPDNWSKPVKQTVLRAQIAGVSEEKTTQNPPQSKRPAPIFNKPVMINSNLPEIVIPEFTELNIITPDIITPSAEMNPEKTVSQALDLPKEHPVALYAILIGAGISTVYLMTHLGKKRGRK